MYGTGIFLLWMCSSTAPPLKFSKLLTIPLLSIIIRLPTKLETNLLANLS